MPAKTTSHLRLSRLAADSIDKIYIANGIITGAALLFRHKKPGGRHASAPQASAVRNRNIIMLIIPHRRRHRLVSRQRVLTHLRSIR